MTKPKKNVEVRDQIPSKDPQGGGAKHGPKQHQLNSVGTEGGTDKNQKHHHGGHSHL
jgi:hypothetical protein